MSVAAELSRRLARSAEAVCRYYLPAGRREGRYWLIGDVENTPGRSLFVRLTGPESGDGAAGRWQDAATGEHGDLLDLIAARQHLSCLRDTLDEARRFLRDPPALPRVPLRPAPRNSSLAAQRLFAAAIPVQGTLGARYLRARGILALPDPASVRFHPRCFRRPDPDDCDVQKDWPALIAAVTDLNGRITGVQRTWLDPSGTAKAPVASPRRELGEAHGHGVRIGHTDDVVAVGEGLETMLSLRQIVPTMPVIAAGSASHLTALILPPTLRRLYIVMDRDAAGERATAGLSARATGIGIDAIRLTPIRADLNDDLRVLEPAALSDALRPQLRAEDAVRFGLVNGSTTRCVLAS